MTGRDEGPVQHGFTFNFELSRPNSYLRPVTAEMFRPEIDEALKVYERYIVCIDKVPDDCERSLESLMEKAIKAYEKRGANMRHGIALDRHVTIILSQTDHDRPLCGIYFNLHSPYQKKVTEKAAKAEK